jgi:hypothetical protein
MWRFTDPNIADPKSIQTYSSNNVFFIVKNKSGKWVIHIFMLEISIKNDYSKRITFKHFQNILSLTFRWFKASYALLWLKKAEFNF